MLTGVTEVVVVNDRGLSAVDARELSRPDQSPGLDRGGDCCMRSCVGHINLICLRYVRCQPHPVLGSVAVHERISPAALPSGGDDLPFMSAAVAEARVATAHADVPVGAVIVRGGEILARARNRREHSGDPTAHAEILALREAGERLHSWRLSD